MVTYLDADTAPLKNTGQIRLYDGAGFEGMRKACDIFAFHMPICDSGHSGQQIDV